MFAVIFEVQPRSDKWDTYLDNAKLLKPELEQVDGFVDNVRYKSLTRDGWLLSLSGWRDEKAVVRWRTAMRHHMVQEKGRSEILRDYHLRVGEITGDTRIPVGYAIAEQRLDETVVGEATTITLIDAKRPAQWTDKPTAKDCAEYLGLDSGAPGLVAWDVFDAVLTPGDLILLISWRTHAEAAAFERQSNSPGDARPEGARLRDARLRRVRVVRDYGMFDRREAPQYYSPVERDGA